MMVNRCLRMCWGRDAVFVGLVVLLVLAGFFALVSPAAAAPVLTVTPLTWNVIGLDSNNVNVGPNNFPVGARVCNSGDTATNVTATFVWDSTDSPNRINLRAGSQNPITWSSLANGACHDFYFEVSIERNADAYTHTRRYRITITTAEGATAATPSNREIYVERLISQNRNATNDVKLDGVSVPPGGAMSLIVGNSYNITLNASTATQGYEQIESFINFPNTIFRINSVTTTYSANAGTDPDAATKMYANGCNWENNPFSYNYRSCYSTGKYGGTVTVVYNVTIIAGAGSAQTLTTLIYDFSGSSYHYNSDYATNARVANIVGPASMTIDKRFVPDSIAPGGTAQLMFTVNNPTAVSIGGVTFTDALPSGVAVASTPGISYSGCGAGAFAGPPTAGATTLTFQNGTIASNSSCIIKINVTASGVQTYNNTTGNLYINTTTNTGNTASASLVVANPTACTPNQTMTTWRVPSTSTNPPDSAGGAPTFRATNVATATASAFLPAQTSIVSTDGVGDSYSWNAYGFKNNGQYYEFVVDTRHYSNVRMEFSLANPGAGNGPNNLNVGYVNGATFTPVYTSTTLPTNFITHTVYFTGVTSASGATTFRIRPSGANSDNTNGNVRLDNVILTGCSSAPPPPTLSKAFSPTTIPTNTVSTLTFTFSNTQTGYEPLTNVTFSDPLPTGLEVANPPASSTSGAGCTGVTFAPTAGATTVNYTASSMAAGATCTAQVNVKPTRAGQFDNVSGYIGATESGQNKTSTGYGTASLLAVAPPRITKQFAASPIFVGNTTVLTFTLSNPNAATQLTGVQFSDTLPAGVTVGTTSSSQCNGTLNTTNPSTIALTGASINANSSCSFGVTVTGATSGVYTNTTGAVSSTNGGAGNTASASIQVKNLTPGISLLKQAGPTASGPWTTFVTRTIGQEVYFRFLIENTGDTTLTNVGVTDSSWNTSSCNPGSLSVYATTTCGVGPATVTGTSRISNTAYATSDQVNSLTSTASYGSYDPSAVTLSRFETRDTSAETLLWVLGIGGLALTGGLVFALARQHAFYQPSRDEIGTAKKPRTQRKG